MEDFRGYTDTTLFSSVQVGNEQAFAEFFARYWPPMYLHAMRMLRDEAACEDVLQEVFLAFWHRAPQLPADTRVEAYLYRMIRNRIIKVIADERQRSDLLADFIHTVNLEGLPSDASIKEADLIALINDEVSKMPPRMREVFNLSRNENLSHREIADRLGISGHTVQAQLNNALKRISGRIGVYFLLLYFSNLCDF